MSDSLGALTVGAAYIIVMGAHRPRAHATSELDNVDWLFCVVESEVEIHTATLVDLELGRASPPLWVPQLECGTAEYVFPHEECTIGIIIVAREDMNVSFNDVLQVLPNVRPRSRLDAGWVPKCFVADLAHKVLELKGLNRSSPNAFFRQLVSDMRLIDLELPPIPNRLRLSE